MITQKRIEEIKQLCKKVVKGPWWTNKRTGVYSKGHEGLALEASEDMLLDGNLDTLDFIAESRTIIPELLSAVESLREENEKLIFHLRNALPHYLRTGYGGATEAQELLEQLKVNQKGE